MLHLVVGVTTLDEIKYNYIRENLVILDLEEKI